MKKRKKRPAKLFKPSPVRTGDALIFSGVSCLVALAMGASPDKALEYGIQTLKLFGAKIDVKDPEDDEKPFMLGLA